MEKGCSSSAVAQSLPMSSCQSCALLGVTVALWAPDSFCRGRTLVLLLGNPGQGVCPSVAPSQISIWEGYLHGAAPRLIRALKIHSSSAWPTQRAHGLFLSCQTRASWDHQGWVFQELTHLPLALSLQETASIPAETHYAESHPQSVGTCSNYYSQM